MHTPHSLRTTAGAKTAAAKTKNGPEAHTIHYILSDANYSARGPFSQATKKAGAAEKNLKKSLVTEAFFFFSRYEKATPSKFGW